MNLVKAVLFHGAFAVRCIMAASWRYKLPLALYFVTYFGCRAVDLDLPGWEMVVEVNKVKLCFKAFSHETTPIREVMFDRSYEIVEGFAPQPGQVVVDLGANIGVYSLVQSRKMGGKGRVYAVEPNPDVYKRLQKNVTLNQALNVHTIEAAVYSRSGRIDFQCERNTLISKIARGETGTTLVTAITLDELVASQGIRSIDILKIDVEGSEIDVLLGGQHALDICRRIVVECEDDDIAERVKALLSNKGFSLIFEGARRATFSHLFFVRDEK